MEVNPLAGLKPNYSHLPIIAVNNGISFFQLVDIIVKSAAERIK
jgi:D-alanine-D-alanine ligase